MNKLMIILAMLLISGAALAVNIYLENGTEFAGEIVSIDDSAVILNDGEVIIRIPMHQIKSVLDEGKDVTKKTLGKATEAVGVDEHFIGLNDYFISEIPLGSQTGMPVLLTKHAGTENLKTSKTGNFILFKTGKYTKSSYWYKTALAPSNKLKKGTVVIFFHQLENGTFRAPLNDEETRTGDWMMAKITNLDNAVLGYVTVADEIEVALNNIRIPVK